MRGFLPGFSYQCGNLIAASIGWLQSTLTEKHHYPYPMVLAISTLCIFIVAIVVIAAGPERHAVDFNREREAA